MKKILVEVKIPDVIKPEDLAKIVSKVKEMVPVERYADHVVIISGRMPVWAFGALIHLFHPFAAVSTFDPRLQGGVVVMSHTPGLRVGDVVPVSDATKIVVDATEEAKVVTQG